tara:strand:+ start:933 stop:1526 length:594 start_codon:yes stop_codon:yes gene_type:complete
MFGFFNKNNRGLTLLEALISTLIVGIGFVAIFQMVQYSITSIDVSSDRNKGNYLVNMVAEDMLANRKTRKNNIEFADTLINSEWSIRKCVNELVTTEQNNTPDNKRQTWNRYFNHGITKCRSDADVKILRIIDICNNAISVDKSWECTHTNNVEHRYLDPFDNNIKSLRMYDERHFGKMQISYNKGLKTRSLYFQIK